MVSEMQIKCAGAGGQILDEMKRRGWQMFVSPMETKSKVEGTKVEIEITWSAGFARFSKPASKAEWDAAMMEIAKEKGFVSA